MKFAHTLETSASVERIWSLWIAVNRWPTWDSELESAQLTGDFCLGATGQLTPKVGPRSKFEISALDCGNGYRFTTQLPLCQLHVHRFLELGEPLKFTHEVSFEGPLAFLFGRVLGKRFQEVLPEVMQALKQLAEQDAESSVAN